MARDSACGLHDASGAGERQPAAMAEPPTLAHGEARWRGMARCSRSRCKDVALPLLPTEPAAFIGLSWTGQPTRARIVREAGGRGSTSRDTWPPLASLVSPRA